MTGADGHGHPQVVHIAAALAVVVASGANRSGHEEVVDRASQRGGCRFGLGQRDVHGVEPSMQRALQARQSEGALAAYVAASVRRAAPEVRRALGPVLDRMAKITALEDPAAQRSAFEALRADFPLIARETLAHVPAAAAIFQEIIGPAFLSGYAEAAQAQKS